MNQNQLMNIDLNSVPLTTTGISMMPSAIPSLSPYGYGIDPYYKIVETFSIGDIVEKRRQSPLNNDMFNEIKF